jgi:hypothetical protein
LVAQTLLLKADVVPIATGPNSGRKVHAGEWKATTPTTVLNGEKGQPGFWQSIRFATLAETLHSSHIMLSNGAKVEVMMMIICGRSAVRVIANYTPGSAAVGAWIG